MKRRDIFIIAAVLIAAMIGAILIYAFGGGKASQVRITVGDEAPTVYPLRDRKVTIDQGNGRVNVVVITEDGVYMSEASCENHDCIEQGRLTTENCETRLMGRFIVCLPNRVTVELIQ